MLSITSKLAALYVQHLKDPVVLGAVRDIEDLAGNLSATIWQKVMILHMAPATAIAAQPRNLPSGPTPDRASVPPPAVAPQLRAEEAEAGS